jgi:hypothetical protein
MALGGQRSHLPTQPDHALLRLDLYAQNWDPTIINTFIMRHFFLLGAAFMLLSVHAAHGQTIIDNGTNVGIGNPSPAFKLDVNGGINLSVGNQITFNGVRALSMPGIRNVAIGESAGASVTSGQGNLFIGREAGMKRPIPWAVSIRFLGYGAGLLKRFNW